METNISFWNLLNNVREQIECGDISTAEKNIQGLLKELNGHDDPISLKRKELLDAYITTYQMNIDCVADSPSPNTDLAQYVKHTRPGTSLVTCSRNRSENLVRALPSWLACSEISEIVIVDWTSDVPVADYLKEHGYDDPKIKVVRVEGESRWILSYAFNVGFQVAKYDKIIKVDADIVLSEEFFANVALNEATYIAGDWRLAEKGQEFINGFFYVYRKNLMAIHGFNEQITTYGWDDDDLYDRLSQSGLKRRSISSEYIHHLPHDDEARMGTKMLKPMNAWEDLMAGTMLEIQSNRFITKLMPPWGANMFLQPFTIEKQEANYLQIRRSSGAPHVVPDHIRSSARYFAALHLLSWRRGQRVFALDQDKFNTLMLLKNKFNAISKLDIEIAITQIDSLQKKASNYAVIKFSPELRKNHQPALAQTLNRLIDDIKKQNRQVVFYENSQEWLTSYLPDIASFPVVPAWCNIGDVQTVTVDASGDFWPKKGSKPSILELNTEAIKILESGAELASPQISQSRPKLFLDAQHGLGNRLRALASGAVVAQRSDRELVVVWEPDHHCEGRLTDLYEYNGAIIEKTFLPEAINLGHTVYNYMEIEEGAQKDAPISLDGTSDIYARSAYVLNSPLSDWAAENQFLHSLTPVEAVRELVAGVRHPNDLSAHVRMVGAPGSDTASYDRRENWTEEGHQQINLWREKSHFSHFMKRIDVLIQEGRADRIFLAADRPETYDEFKAAYGDRLAYLPRELYDRSTTQLRYALADALLLSSSPLLLGSTWSSFSELAIRLSPRKMKIEMSGTDF